MKLIKNTIYFIALSLVACKPNYVLQSHNNEVIGVEYIADSSILSIIDPYQRKIEDKMNEGLSYTKNDLIKGKPQSTIGNFVTDLCLNYADAHLCIMNYGGLRTNITQGYITRGKIYELMPFENELVVLELEKKEQDWRRAKAKDSENMIYRFNTIVDKSHVYECMHILTQWSRRHPKCDIEIVFSSGGGSIVDGFVLFDFIQELKCRGHHVTTGSLGMAASMAGILLQAGTTRWIGHQAWLMIHRAAFGAVGKTFEIEDEVSWIKRIEERILDIFEKRSNLTKTKIKRNAP